MGSLHLVESGVLVHYFSCFWTSGSHHQQQARLCWSLSFLPQLGGTCICCCLMDCFLALLSHWPRPREDTYGHVDANGRSLETPFHTLWTGSPQAALSPMEMTQLSRREGAVAPLEAEAAGLSRGGEAGVSDFQNSELSRAFHLECLGICKELMEGGGKFLSCKSRDKAWS